MPTRHRRIGAFTALAAFGLVVAVAGPAAASTAQAPATGPGSSNAAAQCSPDFTGTGINIRSLPNTTSAVRGQGNPGDCVQVHNARHGGDVTCGNGVRNNFWYDVTNVRTGVRGWVSACYLPAGTPPST